MGYRSSSTRRTSAASAVSSQAVVVNTGTGFSAVGSTVRANTSISLGVTTVGQTSAATVTTVSAGPVISNVAYLDANNSVTSANAVSTSGGNIRITGTGFVTNSAIYINNTLATNTFVSSTQIIATCPAASAGNVAIMIFTPTDTGTQRANAVRYSGAPTWTTAAAALQNGIAANVSLVASSDSTLTYTLQDGSTLPTGISLNGAGYLTGTPTGYSGSASVTVVIIATDAEGQATQQTITISITTGDDQFKYTTLLLNGETSVTPFIKDSSSNNFGLTLAGDVRADRFSPYYGNGYYSNSFSATPDYYLLPVSANLAFAGDYTLECWVYLNSVTGTQGVYSSIDNASDTWAGIYIGFSGTSFLATSYISSADTITHQTAVAVGQWYHLAMVRSGSSTKSYLNGVQSSGTTTSSYSLTQSGSSIGTAYPGSGPLNGYISNLRIVKGTALYTTNFTPPTAPLTAISGTQLLTCQSSRAVDVSSNAFTLTATGTPKVSPAIPFAASSSYATYGSMYVPSAVTNYLALPHTAATTITSGSTDSFSAECWVYFNSATANTSIIDQSGQNTVTFQNWSFGLDGSKQFQIIWGGTGSPGSQIGYISGTTVARSGVWYHLAYVKTGAVWSLFVNGVRETTYSGLNTASDGTSNPLRIGSDTFSSQSINGYIADVRVYKGATADAPYSASSSTITIPTAPLTAVTNTQLLTCQYNGGANNSGIIDNGPFNAIVTRSGNASQGTFSPYASSWSNYFNAPSGDIGLYLGAQTAFAFGTGDFTIEMWVNLQSVATLQTLIDFRPTGTQGLYPTIYIDTATNTLRYYTNSADVITGATVFTYGIWHHVAVARSGTSTKLFLDGVQQGSTYTDTNNYIVGANRPYTGYGVSGTGYKMYGGYLSNLRIMKGQALYTSVFTPSTTTLTTTSQGANAANVSLLTAQSNRVVDNSSNGFTINVAGSPTVQNFGPFSPTSAYSTSVNGGSAYFDGTGDYLTVGTFAPGSNNFTVEFWFYCTALPASGQQGVFFATPWGGNNFQTYIKDDSTIIWQAYTQNNTGVAVKLNRWYHVAIVKNGSTGYFYINGVLQNTATLTNTMSGTATVGAREGSLFFTGYISDMRVSIGTTVYTGAFTPPTAPLTSSTATLPNLLLNFTNGAVIDQHSSNNLETVGNAQVSTAVKKYGNSSMYFDGTGDYLIAPSSAVGTNFAFGTGDFTIEFWLYLNSVSGGAIILDGRPASTNGLYPTIYIPAGATTTIAFLTNSADRINSAANTIATASWYHIALTRASGSTKLFVNGTQVGSTYADTNAYLGGINRPVIAASGYDLTGNMNGYIDDLRITKGFARYTANFTPPTSALLGQ